VIGLLADEHFPHAIVAEVRAFGRDVDFLTVHDLGLEGTPDPQLLEWAAAQRRVIVSYDVNTLIGFATQRVSSQLPMAGLVIGFEDLPVGKLVEDLAIISVCGNPEDLQDEVLFLPL
jgi:hypothetical protein